MIMTPQEKATAYDEAIERTRRMIEDYKNRGLDNYYACAKESLEKIFPELTESEDERIKTFIRGLILPHIADAHIVGDRIVHNKDIDNYRKALAWLEKHKYTEDDLDKAYKCADEVQYRRGYEDAKKEIEKQCEQKPVDKVEPKFKNGQWIVWQDKCYKVNYNGCGYELVDQNGLSTSLEYGTIDENAHLWDITKDAKDGDVLHCWIDGDEFVLIYKGIKDGYITTYGHLYQKLESFSEEPTTMFCRTIQGHFTPATKEQRALLFQKMKEAGYTFDFEKKELKKIVQKFAKFREGDSIQFKGVGHNRYTIREVCGLSHYINTNGKRMDMSYTDANFEVIKDSNKVKLSPAWSEEDERIYQSIMDDTVQENQLNDEQTNWLRDIKYRYFPQPKSDWSEKDKINLEKAIWYVENPAPMVAKDSMLVEWLKSLKGKVQPNQEWSEKYIADVFEKVGLAKIVREQSNDNLTNALQDAMIELSKFTPQPKQKWSEKDTSLCARIQGILSVCKSHSLLSPDLYKEMCDWLKSLRPQNTWKPSDLPHWKKSNLPDDNSTGFNSDYFCYKGYNINYKELFEKLPKDD